MKSINKVCKYLFRKNKSLSIGLFIMSIFIIIIGVLGTNIYGSATKSIVEFINNSDLPDKLYTTTMMSTSIKEELLLIDGVDEIDNRIISECTFELEEVGVFSGNMISYNDKSLNKITILEESEVSDDAIKSYLPINFAKNHNVKAGDNLDLTFDGFNIKTTIKAIISSPETMGVEKDFMSMHEGYSFTNLYVDLSKVEESFNLKDVTNQWLFYFKDNLNSFEKEQVISSINDVFGNEKIYSMVDFEGDKDNLLTYNSGFSSIHILGIFIVILVSLISLGLEYIFIQNIIKKEKRTIGLLKALGYKKKNIITLFCVFALMMIIPAILIGFPLGFLALKITLLIMEPSFFVPFNVISISPLSVLLLTITTLIIGIISSLFSSYQISKIEPSDIYSKNEEIAREPIKLLKNFKGSKFSKISLTAMFRSFRRHLTGTLCISTCILFMFVSLEGYASSGKVRAGGYGDRFAYDYVIRSIDDADYENIKSSINYFDVIEPYIFIDGKTNVGSKRIAAMQEGNTLTNLKDAKNNVLFPGDGVIIDQFTANKNNLKVGDSIEIFNHEFKITGIAIEYVFAISYISFDSAYKLGFTSINGAMVTLKDDVTRKQFSKDIYGLCNDAYLVKMSDTKTYLNEKYAAFSIALVALGIFSFLIGTILIVNTAFMDFNDLKTKYATLRAIGTPMKKIMKISIFENVTRSIVGCLLALPLCYFSATLLFKIISSGNRYYAMTNFFGYYLISVSISLIYIGIAVLITMFSIKKFNFSHHLNNRE